jgi:hypothetical protein
MRTPRPLTGVLRWGVGIGRYRYDLGFRRGPTASHDERSNTEHREDAECDHGGGDTSAGERRAAAGALHDGGRVRRGRVSLTSQSRARHRQNSDECRSDDTECALHRPDPFFPLVVSHRLSPELRSE